MQSRNMKELEGERSWRKEKRKRGLNPEHN